MAQAILDAHSVSVSQFLAAAERPYFQEPDFADVNKMATSDQLFAVHTIQVAGIVQTAQFVLLQAEQYRQAGQIDAALHMILAVVKVGDAIQSAHTTVVVNTMGAEVRSEGLQALVLMKTREKLSGAQVDHIKIELSNLHEAKIGIESALKIEAYF